MKMAYPIIISKGKQYYTVEIPDFPLDTQGTSLEDAIEMAVDAIGGVGYVRLRDNIPLPCPTPIHEIKPENIGDIVTLALVDFEAYRRKVDAKEVRENCTLPFWLKNDAERAGINFSAILQRGLKEELGIN